MKDVMIINIDGQDIVCTDPVHMPANACFGAIRKLTFARNENGELRIVVSVMAGQEFDLPYNEEWAKTLLDAFDAREMVTIEYETEPV